MASLLLLCQILHAFAAPLSNHTSNSTISLETERVAEHPNNTEALRTVFISSWMPPAKVRGTSDVLWSCVVTLSLCVYTAIHLNVPPADEGYFAFWRRKTKWVLLAIFAPEIVVYTAFQQWSEAKKTIRELNYLINKGKRQRLDNERTVRNLPICPTLLI
jgi:hypothetical protein